MSPLAEHCHYSGEFLLYTIVYLGLLLCCDADLYLLAGLGLLFYMW
jgi:hypothetical protein